MFLYFVLGVLIYNVMKDFVLNKGRLVGYCVLIALAYALTDEAHQMFVSGRSSESRDVLIDTLAASLGIVIYFALSQRRSLARVEDGK